MPRTESPGKLSAMLTCPVASVSLRWPTLAGCAALALLLSVACDPYDPRATEPPVRLHTISGTITPTYAGVQATVALSGPVNASQAFDDNGAFQFADLPDGTYTVTPVATDRVFEPSSDTVILAGADAPPLLFGISGDWRQAGPAPTVDSPDYLGILGDGLVDVVAVGTAGAIAGWDGLGVYTRTEGTETCRGIWFQAPGDRWKACDGGTVLFRDGSGTSNRAIASGTTVTLRGVCRTLTDTWVVGDAGTILRGDSSGLAPVASGTTADLHAVVCSGAEVFAAGAGGTILHWDGSALTAEESGTTATLRALLAEPSVAYAVGDGGTILRRSGGSWARESSGTTADLAGVARGVRTAAGSGPIVVGAGGTILRVGRGGGWVAEDSHTTRNLRAVWGSFAVGDGGTVLQRRVFGTP